MRAWQRGLGVLAGSVVLLLAGCGSGGNSASGGSTGSSTGGSTTGSSTTGGSTSGGSTTGSSTTGGSTTGGGTGSTTGGTTGGTTGSSTTGGGTGGSTGGSVSGIDPATGFLLAGDQPRSSVDDGAGSILIADGTAAQSRDIVVGGNTRRYVVIKPLSARYTHPPLFFVLHPDGTSPESTAYITEISDYVLTQGFWAVLPQGLRALGPNWDDDPGRSNTPSIDVPFISTLIDTMVGEGGDASRVYVAGFSNGGFMSERLACDLPQKIAAFGMVAATMRQTLADVCTPSVQRPKLYFLGTADLIVPYNGSFSGTTTGLRSADQTLAFWTDAAQQGCSGSPSTGPVLDDQPDGTSAQLERYSGCARGGSVGLWTVTGGGHQWPGGQPGGIGISSNEISSTGLFWLFFSGLHL